MTDTKTGPKTGMAVLDDVLDTYGADRTRWPAPVRRELSALIASNVEVRKAVAAAEAFDKLLNTAPVLSADRIAALSDRIMDTATRGPRVAVSSGTSAQPRPSFVRRHAAAAAALAASLMVGVFAGQTETVQPVMGDLVEAAQLTNDGNQQTALTDDNNDDGVDGDLL